MAASPIPVLLMLAVISAAGIGFAASLLGDMQDPIDGLSHPMRAEKGAETLHVSNRGLPIATEGIGVAVTVDGQLIEIAPATLERAIGPTWAHGEQLCIRGPGDDCLTKVGRRVTADIMVGQKSPASFTWRAP